MGGSSQLHFLDFLSPGEIVSYTYRKGGSQSQSWQYADEKHIFPLHRIEPRFLLRLTRCLFIIPNERSRLFPVLFQY